MQRTYRAHTETVTTELSQQRQDFVLRSQDNPRAPMFHPHRYHVIDDSVATMFHKTEDAHTSGVLSDRCFDLNITCTNGNSSQNTSYLNDSTLVNSSMESQYQHSSLPIVSPTPVLPVASQLLDLSPISLKKRHFDSNDYPLRKRQDVGTPAPQNFISSDFISSDSFDHINASNNTREWPNKESEMPFPYFSGNQITNLIQSSFDPIFSED